jgi:hypothetical protein
MPTSRPPETPRTDDPRCHVSVGGLRLKNPLICGSGEHTITAAGMQALLQAGAAAVVAKSVNESEAARKQLDGTDYVLLDAQGVIDTGIQIGQDQAGNDIGIAGSGLPVELGHHRQPVLEASGKQA